ncbi:T-lymphocyte surface antigen Ly-9-like isoform X1 [Eumetopias jubatus]|uniref:T-lymphocyte surface antigen Ly-9-like isoform X1 n=2 Tax=Eumetopias jubatus TaxID=34886 RepID=UPI001016EB77|nr:T-lymphocyte surface antigen Ly-9-like isoform X1 [Eumetopias jubatus]
MAGSAQHPDNWALRPFSSKPQKTKPHIPSSFLWTRLLFLFMGLGASGKDSTPTVVPGILGRSVTFPLNISVDTEFEHVTWNGPQGALALATAEKQIFFMAKSYQDRLTISWNSFSLSLRNLTLRDAGSYKAQINRKTSTFTTDKEFTLHVYEQVPEPQVIMKSVNMSDSGSCNITLICFVERAGTSVLYSWTLRDSHASESHEGSTFIIHWRLCDPDLPYICTARNPVSQNTSSPVHARQFCTAPGASRGESMGEMVVGILGESVTLPLTLSASHSGENVIWMFNTSIISKEQKEAATADSFIKFKDPNKNSSQDYSLMIGQLKMENAGHYYAYVCSKASGVISTKHITLLVYGRLKKPTITWHPGLAEDGICRVSLTCSVEDSGHNVTYRWTPIPKGTFESQGGPHLNVSWTSGENHPNFTCIASNPVSNSSQRFLSGNICPGPEGNTELYIGLSLMASILCFGIFIWCIWKRKRPCSDPASNSSHAETPTDTPGCQKLDTFLKTAKQEHSSTSDRSSDFSETMKKHPERTGIAKARRHEEYDSLTQESTGSDSSSEGQAEYDLVTPESMVPASVDNTGYMQVFLNLQGKTPVPEQKESSATIYSCIQTSQKVMPPPQQNDLESPESPTYENFT